MIKHPYYYHRNPAIRNFVGGSSKSNVTVPAVNIKSDENNFTLELAAPGYQKEDFKIEVENNFLKISSEKATEETKEKFSHREFKFADFKRVFTLSKNIDSTNITANYEQGILTVTLPILEEAKPKPAREIEVA